MNPEPSSRTPAAGDLKKSLSAAALITTTSVMASRIIGLVREQALAALAGTSVSMDAYVAAFLIPEILNHILAGGFLSITFIPIFQRHLIEGRQDNAWRSFSNLLTVGTVAMAALIAVCMIAAPDLLRFIARIKHQNADPAFLSLSVKLTRIVLPAQIFFYWGSFLMAVQYAQKRFFWPALMPLCYNAAIIIGGIALWKTMGIAGFAWGVAAGACIGGVLCQCIGAAQAGARYVPVFDLRDPDLRRYVLLTLPFIVGLGMTFSNELVFRVFGMLFDHGTLSCLNYALRVMMLLVGVFGLAFSAASYPFQSQLAAEKKHDRMNQLSDTIIRKICIILFPVSGIMVVLAPEIISLLFERGSFTAASTARTAPFLMLYLPGAFAFAANAIVLRNYYAVQNTLYPMIVSTAALIVSLPFYIPAIRIFGAAGIPAMSSVSMIAQFLIIYELWSRSHDNILGLTSTLVIMLKTLLLSTVGIAACWAIKAAAAPTVMNVLPAFAGRCVVCCLAGIPGLIICFLLLHAAGIQNLREILNTVLRRR
jgi:putative peptidoglycan lipid II flippase